MASAIFRIIAFINSKKSPKVKIVIGSVNNTKTGLTKTFNKLNQKATKTADP